MKYFLFFCTLCYALHLSFEFNAPTEEEFNQWNQIYDECTTDCDDRLKEFNKQYKESRKW